MDNEREILNKLKINSESIYQGFLVDNSWVEKWKLFSNYNNINKLFQVNNITEAEIKNNIRQELLNKKLNFSDLDYIDEFILIDAKQLISPITANKIILKIIRKKLYFIYLIIK